MLTRQNTLFLLCLSVYCCWCCHCDKYQAAPEKKVVERFEDHTALQLDPSVGPLERAALKEAVRPRGHTVAAPVAVGSADFADQSPWEEIGGDSTKIKSLDPQANPWLEGRDQRIGFVAVQAGPLPDFIDYVIESAQWSHDIADFFIFHVDSDASGANTNSHGDTRGKQKVNLDRGGIPEPVFTSEQIQRGIQQLRCNVYMIPTTWEELAERFLGALSNAAEVAGTAVPCQPLHETREESLARIQTVLKGQSATVYGSKINDLKVGSQVVGHS